MRTNHPFPLSQQTGFTALEMLVSIAISLILLAGLYSNFLLQTRVQKMQSQITERFEDLHTASQIIQTELKFARSSTLTVTTGTGLLTVTYDPYDTPTNTCGNANYSATGTFEYSTAAVGTAPGGNIFWKQPGCASKSELLRDLETATAIGFTFTPSGDLYDATLTAVYTDAEKRTRPLTFSFKVWPRNN